MGTDYTPYKFLKKIPNSLLEEYFKTKGLSTKVEIEDDDGQKKADVVAISELAEAQIEPIQRMIEAQESAIQKSIENDFRGINERSCKAGFICLLDEARFEGHGIDIQNKLENMDNHYERAMWVFLKYPEVFEKSGYFQKIDGKSFKARAAWKKLTPKQNDDELEELKQGLIEHYKKEGRGNYCWIEVLKRPDPERYCYFAYLEDYSDTLEEFDGPKFKRTLIKPAFEVIFIYNRDSGRVETNASGKRDEIKDLLEKFCQGVLSTEGLPDKDSRIYSLEKLKDRFDFRPRDPQDNIAYVKLKYIELEVSKKRKIAYTDDVKGSDIYDLMDDALDKEKTPLEAVTVSSAKFQIVFKKLAHERQTRRKTVEIRVPDQCKLKDSPIDMIAKKYLEKWGFVTDETIEVDDEPGDDTLEKKTP